jgi:hypothetical protein
LGAACRGAQTSLHARRGPTWAQHVEAHKPLCTLGAAHVVLAVVALVQGLQFDSASTEPSSRWVFVRVILCASSSWGVHRACTACLSESWVVPGRQQRGTCWACAQSARCKPGSLALTELPPPLQHARRQNAVQQVSVSALTVFGQQLSFIRGLCCPASKQRVGCAETNHSSRLLGSRATFPGTL